MRHVFTAIATHDSAALRLESAAPFHRLQKALIEDTFVEYVTEFARALRAANESAADDCPELLRLVVHIALYLRRLGADLPAEVVSDVLESYIAHLAESHRELVATYVAHMPTVVQTDVYARFLQGIADPAPIRLQLLRLAGRHGLDQAAIAKRTAERVLHCCAGGSDDDSPMDTEADPAFELAEPAEPLTDVELVQIRAIEWVTSSPRLYEHALIEVCGLARRFLLAGRTNAAAHLFNSLPEDFVQHDWVAKADSAAAAAAAAAADEDGGGSSGSVASTPSRSGLIRRGPAGKAQRASSATAGCAVGDDTTSHFHEYIHLLSLCDALAHYSTWAETLCKQPATKPDQGARQQAQWLEWRAGLSLATDQAVEMFRDRLLEVDWL
ncbi:Nucleoporin nup84, partial [Coemansia nantahalensis]